LGLYLTGLTAELVDENKNQYSRNLAGIMLKNRLDSEKNETKRAQYHHDWRNLDNGVRENIKAGVMQALASPVLDARKSAAQAVAKIAQVELPVNMWPTLVDQLLANMSGPLSQNDNLKQSTLLTLGYICEEIDPKVVEGRSDQILTAVVQGMRKEESNAEVKLAAAKALENALEFAKPNFERDGERDYIMGVVCEAVVSADTRVRIAAYQCLVQIASLYYTKLPPYMQSIFSLTLESIKKDPQPVAQQAVEFWSTVCEEEIWLIEEIEEAISLKVESAHVCHNFIRGAIKFLVPLILGTLTQQEEDADEDTWDLSMAGATCLTLIATCVRNDIIPEVVPFVTEHIVNPEWRYREAAVMAFGSILEGPANIDQLIQQALPVLVQHMKDQHQRVKDTTAWTLGKICQLHPLAFRGEDDRFLDHIMTTLLQALSDSSPRVATNASWALNNIAEAFRDEDRRPGESFHRYFAFTVQELLKTTERDDADESNLKVNAYESINSFFAACETEECLAELFKQVPVVLQRLTNSFANSDQILTTQDRDALSETQGMMCGLIQTATQRLQGRIKPFANSINELLLKVFHTKSSTVHEEALMAFGALADAMEKDFEVYMPNFRPYLLLGLRSQDEVTVCTISVAVVGDICRALQRNIAPYCDEIVTILFTHLQNEQSDKSVKPAIFACFGDIALALCGEFQKYLRLLMEIIQAAANLTADPRDDDMVAFVGQLRQGILEAFTGILQGLRTDKQADLFLPWVPMIVDFAGRVYADQTHSQSVMTAAIGVLGDMAHALGSKVRSFLVQDFVQKLINESAQAEDDSMRDTAQWAQELIRKL